MVKVGAEAVGVGAEAVGVGAGAGAWAAPVGVEGKDVIVASDQNLPEVVRGGVDIHKNGLRVKVLEQL